MGAVFGTDGVRGTVGVPPLDRDTVVRMGVAVGRIHQDSRILVGRDTRVSGPRVMAWFLEGLGAVPQSRIRIRDAGVLPTPALSFLVRREAFDLGLMITASHNPARDNGLKFLGPDGEKMPDAGQEALERCFTEIPPPPDRLSAARVEPHEGSLRPYRDFILEHLPPAGSVSRHLVLDGAHGAVSDLAPGLFRDRGYQVSTIGMEPDGENINRACGATSPRELTRMVREQGAQLGFAFDGDGDRLVAVDARGHLADGDRLLWLFWRWACAKGDCPPGVVGTVMSNLALERLVTRQGGRFVRTPVGDRYLRTAMKEEGMSLAAEPSGHIILSPPQCTGDGLLAAAFVLQALADLGEDLETATQAYRPLPQRLTGIPAGRKIPLEQWAEWQNLEREIHHTYGDRLRVLVRYSGTEPLLRILAEGDEDAVRQEMNRLVDFFTRHLNG